jgi:hypothetical protein
MVFGYHTIRTPYSAQINVAGYQHSGPLFPVVVCDGPSHTGGVSILGHPFVDNSSRIIHGSAFYPFS